MGTVLHPWTRRSAERARAGFSPLLDGDGVASCVLTGVYKLQKLVSVPFSMGTVLHRSRSRYPTRSPRLVSVPFSMGTVLHLGNPVNAQYGYQVSVPFSMGTVLHRWHPSGRGADAACFSPLLDGDGVASRSAASVTGYRSGFSPLLDGDGVASPTRLPCGRRPSVSVPFSMGTVLHLLAARRQSTPWQSVSVPFSMGTVLHPPSFISESHGQKRFSPLLDGDGVASSFRQKRLRTDCRFSPLLDGDGVASREQRNHGRILRRFQSPSRWGRCCICSSTNAPRFHMHVSVPFSMGTVLHRLYSVFGQ